MPSDVIQRATVYSSRNRRDLRMPARPDIDPVELADVLSNLVVVEAIDGGRDYMHRIAGAAAETLLGAPMHGARLSRLAGDRDALAAWRNGLALARSFRAPHFARFAPQQGGTSVSAVFLPLSRGAQGEEADFVLTAVIEAKR
ncbi:MAG: PAS domain-containing protein [Alphaproteobacteria bacterium]